MKDRAKHVKEYRSENQSVLIQLPLLSFSGLKP